MVMASFQMKFQNYHYLSRSEVHLLTEALVIYESMSLQGVQKVLLRSLLRQTQILEIIRIKRSQKSESDRSFPATWRDQ